MTISLGRQFNMDVTRLPWAGTACLGLLCFFQGCSAMHSMNGVPAAYMPAEFHGESREGKSTIDLSLLQRSRPDQYRIEAGDVLSVWAPGILGLADTQPDRPIGENPPINMPSNPIDRPTVGFPVTVRDDHSIQLSQLPPIDVYGLTLREVEEKIRQATQGQKILNAETQPRIVVDIHRQRTYRVLVYRQEPMTAPPTMTAAGTINLGQAGKGTSRIVDLRAYENDVAHALAQPGVEGLPGLDARNVIHVIRSRHKSGITGRCPPPPSPPQGMEIRGQSPDGFRGRVQRQSASAEGPYDYLTTSQFSLTGRDVSRGYSGPPLSTGIPLGHSVAEGRSAKGNGQLASLSHSPTASGRSLPAGNSWAGADAYQSPIQIQQPHGSPNDPYSGSYRQGGMPVVSQPPVRSAPMAFSPNSHQTNPYQAVQYAPQPTYAIVPNQPSPSVMPVAQNVAPGFAEPPVANIPQHEQTWSQTIQHYDPTIDGDHIVKIPVRLAPGESLDISEEDITLYDGDIVFIESREADVYYIGGLLGGGQYTLPRDKDLHVLEALSLAQGQNSVRAGSQGLQSSGGVSALNRDVVPSASRLLIIRQVNCQQVHLEVDLYRALKSPSENIVIQPGDMLILQYTKCEAMGAFFQRNLFEGALLGIAAGTLQGGGSGGN